MQEQTCFTERWMGKEKREIGGKRKKYKITWLQNKYVGMKTVG